MGVSSYCHLSCQNRASYTDGRGKCSCTSQVYLGVKMLILMVLYATSRSLKNQCLQRTLR